MSAGQRLSPGLYRDARGRIVPLSRSHAISSRNGGKKKKSGKRKSVVRGREVTVRETAAAGQVIYGEMRAGGVYTFIDTNKNSKAYLRTGSDNSQIVWIAKAAGSTGNGISVVIECYATASNISVTVVGDDITVRVKSSSGTSQSSANQVIAAIQASSPANALVSVHKGEGTGAGNVQAESVQSLTGGGGTWLHQYITLACHEIDSVQKLYLDEREVFFPVSPTSGHTDTRWATGDFLNKAFMAVQHGTDSQTVQLDLQAQVGSAVWTDDHRQRGCAGAYLITVWSASLFPDGIPDISFLIRGKKCYDFRTGLTVWTQNAALIIADHLMDTKYGLGVPLADMDVTNWQDAADLCDETVSLVGGGTEPRYTINGTFDTSDDPLSILEDMVQAIAGDVVYQGGKWRCYPAKYRAPSLSFGVDDLLSTIQVRTTVPKKDRFNSVKGSFTSSDKYVETDYPVVVNSGFVTQDGGTLWADINQPFVTSPSQCQRVAKIELERVRQGIEVKGSFKLRAINLQVGDTLYFTYARFGWSSKIFEVRDVVIEETLDNGPMVSLLLRETASGIYVWSTEETAVDLAPNTNLPSALECEAPNSLIATSGTDELYINGSGSVISRIKMSWTAPNDIFVTDGGHYEIQFKRNDGISWTNVSNVPGQQTFTYITDVSDRVRYDVRVRAVNAAGTVSDWVGVTHDVIGKTAPPSDVSSLTLSIASFGIQATWPKVADADVMDYELRLGESWSVSSLVAVIRGSQYRVELKSAGVYTFFIKAIDSSGNYSTNATSKQITVTAPAKPVLGYSIDGRDLVLNWEAITGQFAVDAYEIRYGDTYAGSTLIGEVKTTTFRTRVTWGGNRTFWVATRDVAGNLGGAQSKLVTILSPGSPNSPQIEPLDNNAIIRWTAATAGSLPIENYQLYKGVNFEDATFLGDTGNATFASQFELVGGNYTYWLVAVDSAGNLSDEVSVTVFLDEPPDFIFLNDYTFNPATDSTFIHEVLVDGVPYFESTEVGEPMGLLLAITYAE